MLKLKTIFFSVVAFSFSIYSFCNDYERNENQKDNQKSSIEQQETQEIEKTEEKSFVGKGIFSLDFSYLGTGIKNNGWGIGLSYERSIFDFLAAKGSFSHMTMYPKKIDSFVTTVGIKLEAIFYPFSSGLDKLYIGFGGGSDFLMYDVKDENNESIKDTIITIYPEVGWKQNFLNYVFIDIFCGYTILLSEPSHLSYETDLVDNGIKYGIRVKLNLVKIWQWIFGKKKQLGQNCI